MADTGDEIDNDAEDVLSTAQLIALLIFIVLSFAIIGFLIWAGFNSWRWELALPLGALALLVTRVGKNFTKRVLSKSVDIVEIIADLDEDEPTFNDVDMSPETRRVLSLSSKDPKTEEEDSGTVWLLLLLYVLMIFVAVFWYGLGMIAGLIFT